MRLTPEIHVSYRRDLVKRLYVRRINSTIYIDWRLPFHREGL